MLNFDFLIIGGGIAGLSYALEVAKHGTVGVLSKKGKHETSTSYAQGGIAAVQDQENDSYELHIEDTLKAGAGLSDPEITRIVVTEGSERVSELIEMGAQFDRNQHDLLYNLHQEGGHSRRRILHSADATGQEIQKTLLKAVSKFKTITLLENYIAIDVITSEKAQLDYPENTAIGVYALLPDGKVEIVTAKKILMSTGGAGKVYLYTSNPDVASGDGIAMCYRAGADIANMEFFQFHPTCLYHPEAKSFLISEALRGEGATLHRKSGERFMFDYHEMAELAPRDVVAKAIDLEMKKHGEDFVFLDILHKAPPFIKEHFPNIYETCLKYGIDITKERIPVVPAAHYCCGGVDCNEFGQTKIKNLYVAGECSHTGLHGANRLASNSLLEGLVFGRRAGKHSIETFEASTVEHQIPEWDSGSATDSDEAVVISQNWDEIRRFMWNYVGIARSDKRLARALDRSKLIDQEINQYYWDFKLTSDLLELRNLSLVANLVIRSAMLRKESRGLHYNLDYPDQNPRASQKTLLNIND